MSCSVRINVAEATGSVRVFVSILMLLVLLVRGLLRGIKTCSSDRTCVHFPSVVFSSVYRHIHVCAVRPPEERALLPSRRPLHRPAPLHRPELCPHTDAARSLGTPSFLQETNKSSVAGSIHSAMVHVPPAGATPTFPERLFPPWTGPGPGRVPPRSRGAESGEAGPETWLR